MSQIFNPSETHASFREMLREFVRGEVEPQANDFNRREELNVPLMRQLGDLGLFGLTVDEEYGGSGMDATAVVMAHEELSYSDPALCLSYLAHSLLLVNNLHVNGSHEQKERFLPDCVSGVRIGGMGMSESGAGTDVLGMKAKASRLNDHDMYVLNGQKMWIT